MVSIKGTIPDSLKLEVIKTSDLPVDWKGKIIPVSLQQLGTEWAGKAKSAVLKVPSVIIEHEWNYVLNPLHPDFSKINWDSGRRFSLDPRLVR